MNNNNLQSLINDNVTPQDLIEYINIMLQDDIKQFIIDTIQKIK